MAKGAGEMALFVFAVRVRQAGRACRPAVAGVAAAVLWVLIGVWGVGAPVAHANYRDCSLKTLKACENMNQLIWAKDFRAAFDAFIDTGSRWHDILWSALAGVWVKDKVRWLRPDLVRFSGCRAHDCGFKGAVFLSADGRILQAAVIDSPCSGSGCGSKNVVYVLTHDPDPELVRYAHEWAIEALEIDPKTGKGPYDVVFERAQIVMLPQSRQDGVMK